MDASAARGRGDGAAGRLVAVGALALSVAVHVAFATAARRRAPDAIPFLASIGAGRLLCAHAERQARPARLAAARRELISDARAQRRAGRLELGEFLLRANAIDAAEAGRGLDVGAARAAYAARVDALRAALRSGAALRDAVPDVFGDLRYHGRPGGWMAEALIERAGSCEPLSHLIAAAAHDAAVPGDERAAGAPRRPARRVATVALRFYGDASGGAAHLAPVLSGGGPRQDGEHDLMRGGPSHPGGVRFEAADLIEIYARLHGGDPAPSAAAGGLLAADAPASAQPSLATMAAGYPANADRFPGALPLYAARAVHAAEDAPDDDSPTLPAADRARDCAFYLRMAVLDPPSVRVGPNGAEASSLSFEPRRLPRPSELERTSALISAAEATEHDAAASAAERLMAWACLAALGDKAAIDFTLAGERALATLSAEKASRALREGARAVQALPWAAERGAAVRRDLASTFAGRSWLLLVLPGGESVVRDLVTRAAPDDWGQVNALAALVVAPRTRPAAIEMVGRLPLVDQVDVMHEVFHAHDHLRPWASNFSLESPVMGGPSTRSEFERAYGVFRGMAWRLWDAARPVDETLAVLGAAVRAAALGEAWEAAMVAYYGRNALGLHRQRADGMEVVRALLAAPVVQRHPALDALRKRLAFLQGQAGLDAVTLSDAWRIR